MNAYVIFSNFFPFFMWKKIQSRSVFFMHMHELRCKIYPTKKEPDFYWSVCSFAKFFHEEKNNGTFALLFLNCTLWMKNNRVNYRLAQGPFKGERCFRKRETRQHQVLSALIMTLMLFETPLCFQIRIYQARE